jgi:dipeptidyl aminopeptidase
MKRWRHSGRSEYYVHDLDTRQTAALTAQANPPTTAYALWSPHNHSLAYVDGGDLYLRRDSGAPAMRISTGANLTIPWVYEEEVLSGDKAVYWSPDGARIAYLSFDESRVPLYDVPIYNPAGRGALPYPRQLAIPYPKPGRQYENPTVAVHVYDVVTSAFVHVDLDRAFAPLDRVVVETAWVTAIDLIVKVTDRLGKHLKVVHADLRTGSTRTVRDVDYRALDGGWHEPVRGDCTLATSG